MDKWKRSLTEDVTGDFEARVLAKARPLLKENAALHAQEKACARGFRWFWLAVPAGALAVALILVAPRLQREAGAPGEVATGAPLGAAADELEMAMDFEMYKDLREIENLDLLKELGDPKEWPKRKRAPKS